MGSLLSHLISAVLVTVLHLSSLSSFSSYSPDWLPSECSQIHHSQQSDDPEAPVHNGLFVRQNPWTSFDPTGLDPDIGGSPADMSSSIYNTQLKAYPVGQTPYEKSVADVAVGGAVAVGVSALLPEVTGGSAIAVTARLASAGISSMAGGNAANMTDNLQNGKPLLENAPSATLFSAIAGVGLQGVGEGVSSIASAAGINAANKGLVPSTSFEAAPSGKFGGTYVPYDNSSGGTLWLSNGQVGLADERAVVTQNNLDTASVSTLQGFHGSPSGMVTKDDALVGDANTYYSGTGTKVIDMTQQKNMNNINAFANSPDHTIAAWCYSEQNFLPSGTFTSPFPPLPALPQPPSPAPSTSQNQ